MKNISFTRWLATSLLYVLLWITFKQGTDSPNVIRAITCSVAIYFLPAVHTLYTLSVMKYPLGQIRRELAWHDIGLCTLLMFVTVARATLFIIRPNVLTAVAVLYAFIYFFLWLLLVGMEKHDIRRHPTP